MPAIPLWVWSFWISQPDIHSPCPKSQLHVYATSYAIVSVKHRSSLVFECIDTFVFFAHWCRSRSKDSIDHFSSVFWGRSVILAGLHDRPCDAFDDAPSRYLHTLFLCGSFAQKAIRNLRLVILCSKSTFYFPLAVMYNRPCSNIGHESHLSGMCMSTLNFSRSLLSRLSILLVITPSRRVYTLFFSCSFEWQASPDVSAKLL